jgi:GTP cyclohydrolase IA
VKALEETTRGYREDPAQILSKTFSQEEENGYAKYNGIVVLRDIEFCSQCEHHMLPFVGKAHIAYLPGEDGRIVGISKLARLVDCFARRLQVQERLTAQIADAIETHLGAAGVLVVVEAQHYCMRMRGVGKQYSSMITEEARGEFWESGNARREVLQLMGKGES